MNPVAFCLPSCSGRQDSFFLFFIYDPLHLVQKKDFSQGVPEERKPPAHIHKHMLASWGTFLKRWICLLGTAASLSYFTFLSFLFSSFPLSFSFVFLQIENKENKTVLNFYFSPVTKSFRMLSSQSLLLCTLQPKKKQLFPSTLKALISFNFFFLQHYFICAFLSFALNHLAILQRHLFSILCCHQGGFCPGSLDCGDL